MSAERSGRESLASAMPKRYKKTKNTIINDKERHIIYHNRNKAKTTTKTNKRNQPTGPGPVSKNRRTHTTTNTLSTG
jgi:hypothetical protein